MAKATTVRLPTGGKWEIESLVTAGVWTDVTADVDTAKTSVSIHYGRTSEFSPPQQATLTVTLRNFDKTTRAYTGNYIPQNASSPYYPNIQPRKRIRYSYNPGTQRFRFFGYIKQWQPILDGDLSYTTISAQDRVDQFSRVTMLSPIRQEITLDKPVLWWPLSDAQGATSAAEQSGNLGAALGILGTQANPLVFGVAGPGFGDGTGVSFAPASLSAGQYLTGGIAATVPGGGDIELIVQPSATTGSAVAVFGLDSVVQPASGTSVVIGINSSGKPTVTGPGGASLVGTGVITDGKWHHLFLGFAGTSGSSRVYTLYVDGVSVATQTVTTLPSNFAFRRVAVGQTALQTNTSALFTGSIGQVAIYGTALSSTRIAAHAAAAKGYYGDTTDQRIARFLGYGGLTSSDWNLDTGQIQINTYPQDGKDALSGCQDMVTCENGGAAFYVTPDGKARFANRRYRDSRTPVVTIDAVNDLDASVYAPSLDDLSLVNAITVNRADQTGTLTSQTYSVATGDIFASPVTTYTVTDADALNLAQYLVNAQANAALRFPQIAVNLATAFNDLYDAVGQVQIGSRIRVSNIPSNAYPVSQLDFFVEGWTETIGVDSYQVVFDVTAADNPPRWQWDVSNWDSTDSWTL